MQFLTKSPMFVTILIFSFTSRISEGSLLNRLLGPISRAYPVAMTPENLRSFAGKEEIIYRLLKDLSTQLEIYVDEEKSQGQDYSGTLKQLNAVQIYVRDYEMTTGKLNYDFTKADFTFPPDAVAWNPIATYHMLRRLVSLLWDMLYVLDDTQGHNTYTIHLIHTLLREVGIPLVDDFWSSVDTLLKIQRFYNLSAYELFKGKVSSMATEVPLYPQDVMALADRAMELEMYQQSLGWLEVAVTVADNTDYNLEELGLRINEASNELQEAMNEMSPIDLTALGYEQYHDVCVRNNQVCKNVQTASIQEPTAVDELLYREFCKGHSLQTPEEEASLFCWYESKQSAWLFINPMKSELISRNPLIVKYHNFIGNTAIENLMEIATPTLGVAMYNDENPGGARSNSPFNAFVEEAHYLELAAIPKTIEAVTGFKALPPTASDQLLVSVLGVGDEYEPGHDANYNEQNLEDYSKVVGARFATILFQLSDVEEGGATVFTQEGIVIQPEKGSAILWFNILPMFDVENPVLTATENAECPVILGEKRIAKKWIRAFDQFKDFKCDPHRSYADFKVNGRSIYDQRRIQRSIHSQDGQQHKEKQISPKAKLNSYTNTAKKEL